MQLAIYPCKIFAEFVEQNATPNIVICEVGCYQGETTTVYAPVIKKNNGKIILIDWFRENEEVVQEQLHGLDNRPADDVYNNLVSNLQEIDCLDITTIYRERSDTGYKNIADNSLDICFLDACHQYEDVRNDILNYLPKVKSGGLLTGHDFDQPPVYQAVTELLPGITTINDYPPPIGVHHPVWIYRK